MTFTIKERIEAIKFADDKEICCENCNSAVDDDVSTDWCCIEWCCSVKDNEVCFKFKT